MWTLNRFSSEVCKRIIATEFHADVLDYLSSVDKLRDDANDEVTNVEGTVRYQLRMLFNVVVTTSAHDDFRQRHAVDIARKFLTLTSCRVIVHSRHLAILLSSVCIVQACKLPMKGCKYRSKC